ncbi:hypothetical protein JTE90_003867 [Oedothorax gibbosus]|uniref:BTB domain-containing protein n=1 Tax=Oedothorax gibbosus TaxID=931172 RepID=A0AAV6UGL4_9ARAC|nr:hypothetical protein JTE90_003867 [Oedothorax gibbosus]
MALIFRGFRRFFGSLISCITSTDNDQNSDECKYQDAYAYFWKEADDENKNVKMINVRMLSDSKDDLPIDTKDEDDPEQPHQNFSEGQTARVEFEFDEFESKHEDKISEDITTEDSESINEVQHTSSFELQQNTEENKIHLKTSSESTETAEPSIEVTESKAKDSLFEKAEAYLPFPMITNFPDVIVKVGKNHKFPATKKVLCDYSEYFNERLASNREKLCVLKVDERYVSPEAFKTILRFMCFQHPFTCHNLTTEVISTATYLEMPRIICKIEMMLHYRIVSVENARTKLALTYEIREQLENSLPVANNPVNARQAIFKGQIGNLKAKHLIKLSDWECIRKEKEWLSKGSIELDKEGSLFEKLAMRPHIVVEGAKGPTLWMSFMWILKPTGKVWKTACGLVPSFLLIGSRRTALGKDHPPSCRTTVRATHRKRFQ